MKNTVELIGFYGDDIVHAQSAWTSTSRDLDESKLNRVASLLDMLAADGHHTPFEKSSLHFLVNTDIATHIQLLKHRIGVSINAESARYKELKDDKNYLPEDWPVEWIKKLESFSTISNSMYHDCVESLTPVLGRKRAKESARFFKLYNSQITSDIMFNWRSFYHFLQLRNSEHAQVEIRDIAQQMLTLVKEIPDNPFRRTINAFKL